MLLKGITKTSFRPRAKEIDPEAYDWITKDRLHEKDETTKGEIVLSKST